MTEEIRPVCTVRTRVEGEVACTTLREHGIKCDCVELPSVQALTSPWPDNSKVLTVIVAPEDVERAHAVLEEHTDLL
jgi:hypothetical protein